MREYHVTDAMLGQWGACGTRRKYIGYWAAKGETRGVPLHPDSIPVILRMGNDGCYYLPYLLQSAARWAAWCARAEVELTTERERVDVPETAQRAVVVKELVTALEQLRLRRADHRVAYGTLPLVAQCYASALWRGGAIRESYLAVAAGQWATELVLRVLDAEPEGAALDVYRR